MSLGCTVVQWRCIYERRVYTDSSDAVARPIRVLGFVCVAHFTSNHTYDSGQFIALGKDCEVLRAQLKCSLSSARYSVRARGRS